MKSLQIAFLGLLAFSWANAQAAVPQLSAVTTPQPSTTATQSPPSAPVIVTSELPQAKVWRHPDCSDAAVLADPKNKLICSHPHRPPGGVIIQQPVFIQQPVTGVYSAPAIYDANINIGSKNDFMPVNIWSSGIYKITAGYLPSNPLAGLMMMEELTNGAAPRIIFMPTATGPARLVRVEHVNGLPVSVKLVSVEGNYPSSKGVSSSAPGKTTYVYNVNSQTFETNP